MRDFDPVAQLCVVVIVETDQIGHRKVECSQWPICRFLFHRQVRLFTTD
jgi:hypothetical protein